MAKNKALTEDKYNKLLAIAQEGDVSKEELDTLLTGKGYSIPETYASQHPVEAKIAQFGQAVEKGAAPALGLMGEVLSPVSELVEKVPTAYETFAPLSSDVTPTQRVLGAINVPATGVETLARTGRGLLTLNDWIRAKAEEEVLTAKSEKAREAAKDVLLKAEIRGAIGEMFLPTERLGAMGALAGLKKPTPGKVLSAGQKGAVRPGVEATMRAAGAEAPFEALAAAERQGNILHGLEMSRQAAEGGALSAEMAADVAREKALRTARGGLPKTEAEVGTALQQELKAQRAAVSGKLEKMSVARNKKAAEYSTIPEETIDTAKQLSADIDEKVLSLGDNATLKTILDELKSLERQVLEQDPLLMGASAEARTVRVSTGLDKMLQMRSDLGKFAWKKLGTREGAWTRKLLESLDNDIEGLSAKIAIKDPKLAKSIKSIRQRWKAYYEVFDNPDVVKAMSADNPADVYQIFKNEELARNRFQQISGLRKAPLQKGQIRLPLGQQGVPRGFEMAKKRFVGELIDKMDNVKGSASRLDVLDSAVRDPISGKTLVSMLTPEDLAGLRLFAEKGDDAIRLFKEAGELEELIKKESQVGRTRRLSDLGQEGATAAGRAEKLWQGMSAKQIMRYFASLGSAAGLWALHHPMLSVAAAGTGVGIDAFSRAYAFNQGFRNSVNLALRLKDAEVAAALNNAGKAFFAGSRTLDIKEEATPYYEKTPSETGATEPAADEADEPSITPGDENNPAVINIEGGVTQKQLQGLKDRLKELGYDKDTYVSGDNDVIDELLTILKKYEK